MRNKVGLFDTACRELFSFHRDGLPLRLFLSQEEKSDDLIRRTNMKDKNITVNSPNFFEWLALLFIGLRLTGVIVWPWLWVLAPLWLPVSLALLIACVVVLCRR